MLQVQCSGHYLDYKRIDLFPLTTIERLTILLVGGFPDRGIKWVESGNIKNLVKYCSLGINNKVATQLYKCVVILCLYLFLNNTVTSVIFVHGTGGRQRDYDVTFQTIKKALQKCKPDAKLIPCLWGDSLGAKLNTDGASIPTYGDSEGGKELTPEEENIRLWEALYKDPFYEIRLLGLRSLQSQSSSAPGYLTPAQKLQSRVAVLSQDSELQKKLNALDIGKYFLPACEAITGTESEVFGRLLATASVNLDGDYAAIARAIVAMSGLLYEEREWSLNPLIDEELRNKSVDVILEVLSKSEISRGLVTDWITGQLFSLGTNAVKRKRGALSDGAYPFAGDIMVYQAKGKKIRDYIRSQIELVETPVVLLAHSLGGIACVDLLIEEDLRDRVKLLITVGSQAPFLYEIDALPTLNFGEPLPEHFPQWLNIYDLRDFLSYIGEGVFPGKLRDVVVNNKQPFPESHSAYWANQETWDAIDKVLP